jgi:hypothetical protein
LIYFSWLQLCHKEHDREFLFLDRSLSVTDQDVSIFKQVKFRHLSKVLKTGDKIKWKQSSKSSNLIFGEIIEFVVPEKLSTLEVSL